MGLHGLLGLDLSVVPGHPDVEDPLLDVPGVGQQAGRFRVKGKASHRAESIRANPRLVRAAVPSDVP